MYFYERLANCISYFAAEHYRISGKPLYKTTLLKYIALFYYTVLKECGDAGLDISFIAMAKGPVAEEVYVGIDEDAFSSEEFEIRVSESSDGTEQRMVVSKKYTLDCFSEFEIETMNSLLERFSTDYRNSDAIINETHNLIPWKTAWESRGISRMKKMNDADIFKGTDDPFIIEHYYTQKALSGVHSAR